MTEEINGGGYGNWPRKTWKPSGWEEKVVEVKPDTPHPHRGTNGYQAGCEQCREKDRLKQRRMRGIVAHD